MGRQSKTVRVKEPVHIRERKLKDGGVSLYLDIYYEGVRKYESLNLFIVPERTPLDKMQNKHARKVAEQVKAERILALQGKGMQNLEKVRRSSMPLTQWLAQYERESFGFATSTLKGRKEMRLKVEDYLADIGRETLRMNQVDADFCRGFIVWLPTSRHGVIKSEDAKISMGCALHHQAVFNGAMNRAVRLGIVDSNPMRLLDSKEKLRPTENERDYLTIEELRQMMACECPNGQVKRAFIFSCFTGLRLSDVRTLSWSKIQTSTDGGTRFICMNMQKTGELLNLPLSAEALRCLAPKEDAEEPIFRLPGTPTISHDLRRWTERAGVAKHVTFHVSRHTFATMMLTLGVDIYTVSKLLGHKNIATTQIYAKIVDEKKVRAVQMVDNLFNTPEL